VKPANVLLRADGTAVLCDFGIARREDLAGETRTGMALGSVAFMAPEQRIDARRVAPAADLYAAACTLFSLVTGETPIDLYLAPDHSPRWEGVPAPLRPVLRRGTRVEIAERFHDAGEMRAALIDVLPGLRALPAQPRPRVFVTPSHVPTRVDEPAVALSLDAGRRGSIEPRDWGWAHRPSGAGRPALWVGTALLAIVTAVGLVTGPLADSAVPERALAPATVVAAPPLAGSWVGTLGASRRADLVLSGTGDRLTGHLVVRLGHHESRSTVVGRWDPAAHEVVLEEQGVDAPVAVWRARPSSSGLVLEGEVARAGAEAPLPFAFVRME
jgi:serine/threonine-protein kinase